MNAPSPLERSMNVRNPRAKNTDLSTGRHRRWRGALVSLSALSFALPLMTLTTASGGDEELAFLLRGMAVLKGFIALGYSALLFWRFRAPIASWAALLYLGCAAAAWCSVSLVWLSRGLGPVSFLFHGALLVAAAVSMKDGSK